MTYRFRGSEGVWKNVAIIVLIALGVLPVTGCGNRKPMEDRKTMDRLSQISRELAEKSKGKTDSLRAPSFESLRPSLRRHSAPRAPPCHRPSPQSSPSHLIRRRNPAPRAPPGHRPAPTPPHRPPPGRHFPPNCSWCGRNPPYSKSSPGPMPRSNIHGPLPP